jgi:hypothetical protein
VQVVQAASGENGNVLIEVEDTTVVSVDLQGAALGGELEGRTEEAIEKLREVGDSIAEVCKSIQGAVAERLAQSQPDEFTLEFGVKIGGEGSVIISKVSGEASLKVTGTWRST